MPKTMRSVVTWGAVLAATFVPLLIASQSPFLEYRQPVYIVAGFAGIVGLALLLIQPLLAQAVLPGLSMMTSRRVHRWTGMVLVGAVVIHVIGLWITSPPDVVDVLLFRSPTPFSLWGVIAMWAVFVAAVYAIVKKPMRIRPKVWRRVHLSLAVVITISTVAHAVLIEGTMGQVSKVILCALAIAALGKVIWDQIQHKRRKIIRTAP